MQVSNPLVKRYFLTQANLTRTFICGTWASHDSQGEKRSDFLLDFFAPFPYQHIQQVQWQPRSKTNTSIWSDGRKTQVSFQQFCSIPTIFWRYVKIFHISLCILNRAVLQLQLVQLLFIDSRKKIIQSSYFSLQQIFSSFKDVISISFRWLTLWCRLFSVHFGYVSMADSWSILLQFWLFDFPGPRKIKNDIGKNSQISPFFL